MDEERARDSTAGTETETMDQLEQGLRVRASTCPACPRKRIYNVDARSDSRTNAGGLRVLAFTTLAPQSGTDPAELAFPSCPFFGAVTLMEDILLAGQSRLSDREAR